MKIVIDGMGAEAADSTGVILEHFVRGWAALGTDELTVVIPAALQPVMSWPATVKVEPVTVHGAGERVIAQSLALPRICRRTGADALVGLLPSTTVLPVPCPRVVLTFDLRYELLPQQFARKTRIRRKIAYVIGWRQADAIAAISERTRQDMLREHPWLRRRRVGLAPLGSDHVASWPVERDGASYALAFGQFGHKNADMVIDAWGILRDRGKAVPIRMIGMSDAARAKAGSQIAGLGLEELVTPVGWLFGDELRRCFASARLFVFPSDFEGFGLPAVEAMQLGIPLVVTPEPALLEITAGRATVMKEWTAEALADAVERALQTTPSELDAARARASEFTWAGMASDVRDLVTEVMQAKK